MKNKIGILSGIILALGLMGTAWHNQSLTGTLKFLDSSATHYMGIKAPSTVTSNATFTLPNGVCASGQVMKDNGSGVLTCVTISSAKGDILCGTGSGTWVDLGVGSDGQVLASDSAQPCGVKWTANVPAFVGAKYRTSGNVISSTATLIKYSTLVYDTNSAYSTSTGLYSCPYTGYYLAQDILDIVGTNGGTGNAVYNYVAYDGVLGDGLSLMFGNGSTQNARTNGSSVIFCTAGHTISFYGASALGTVLDSGQWNYFTITYLGN